MAMFQSTVCIMAGLSTDARQRRAGRGVEATRRSKGYEDVDLARPMVPSAHPAEECAQMIWQDLHELFRYQDHDRETRISTFDAAVTTSGFLA